MSIPVLMITYNRMAYSELAIEALLKCPDAEVFIIDNGSHDGTVEWLKSNPFGYRRPHIFFNKENIGISGAFNQFLSMTARFEICGKIDNDTIAPPDWIAKMLPLMNHTDLLQARHHIIPATCPGGWDEFVKPMVRKNGLIYNSYIGGSGILFNREKVNKIPVTESKIMGWRAFQVENPSLRKAFTEEVEIKLLDEDGYPEEYKEYYKSTGRI